MFPLIRLLEHVDLLVGPAEEDLVEEVFVRPGSFACAVQEVDISLEGTEGEEDESVFKPEKSAWSLLLLSCYLWTDQSEVG